MPIFRQLKLRTRANKKTTAVYGRLEQRQLLASLTVTTFDDVVDSGDGLLSLREAVSIANSNAETDVIVLAAGTYRLSIAGGAENGNQTGDLDIQPDGGNGVTIQGAGVNSTAIDAAGIDRVLDVQIGSTVALNGLTLTGGSLTEAAQAELRGAGIRSFHSSLRMEDVLVTANGGETVNTGLPVFGGGMYVAGGDVHMLRTEFSGNSAFREGAAVYMRAATANMRLVNIHHNASFQRMSSFVSQDSDIDVRQFKFDLNDGGFHTFNGTVDFNHVRFYGNEAAYRSWGAIRINNSVTSGTGMRMVGNIVGIYSSASPQGVTISDSTFIDNNRAIEFAEHSILVSDSIFQNNDVGIEVRHLSTSEVYETRFENLSFNNDVDAVDIYSTGIVYMDGISVNLNENAFGSLLVRVVADQAELRDVHVNGIERERGVVLEAGSQAAIVNSSIVESGGIHLQGNVDIINTVIHDNYYSGDGGAIYWRPAANDNTLNIINSRVSKNRVRWSSARTSGGVTTFKGGDGAAVFVDNSYYGDATGVTVNSINTAFIANQSTNDGVFEVKSNVTVGFNFHNSILWNNFSPLANGGTLFRGDFAITATHNIVSEVAPGDTDLLFLPSDNNTSVNPIFVDYANDDFRLQSNSPAIDAGDNAFLVADQFDVDHDMDTSEFTPDLDLLDRVFGGAVDIGPYEFR